jgi:hypothetical protein
MAWLYPWSVSTYPGMHRGILAIFSRPYTWQGVRHWLRENARLPAQASLDLRDAIKARVDPGLVLIAELEAHAAKMEAELKRVPPGLSKNRFSE